MLTDANIHYRLDGPDDAPVLVLSNSLGTALAMWDAQMMTFARHFRVLRYDSRGHGRSGVAPAPYTIERLGRDVLGLLDTLRVARAHFCGLSMGGMVGQWLGLNAAERLDRLVLCNTGACIGTAEVWNARMQAVDEGGMSAVADGVLGRWFTPAFRAREPQTVAAVQRQLLATPPQGYVACCAAIRDMDVRADIAAIRAPTLVITGEYDASTPPQDGRFLAEQIPGARLQSFPTAHLSNIEASETFTRAVVDFLTE